MQYRFKRIFQSLSKIEFAFVGVLLIKIFFSFLFASPFLKDLFIPFLNFYTESGFNNPWDYFYELNKLRMFPYPPVMLWIMAIPRTLFGFLLTPGIYTVTPLHLLISRIPVLAADCAMYILLIKILPGKKKIVFWLYWVSPVVFFVNYIHGQLDIIPMAILLFSLYLLFRNRSVFSSFVYAISLLVKSHVIIVLPFILVYLFRKKTPVKKFVLMTIAFLFPIILLNLMYFSESYFQMVYMNSEQMKLFAYKLLNFYIAPMSVFMLFLAFLSQRKLNQHLLMLYLGILFMLLVIVVPPREGWYLWSIPFMCYFFVKNNVISRSFFGIFSLLYVLYFSLFGTMNLSRRLPVDYNLGELEIVVFSLLSGAVIYLLVWMFKTGQIIVKEYRIQESPFLIGVAGDSGSGKHTLNQLLSDLLGIENVITVFGDDMHKWPRGHESWASYTHLDPKGNKLHKQYEYAVDLKHGNSIVKVNYNHETGKFTDPVKVDPNKNIIFTGLHPFYLKDMQNVLDLKIYCNPDENLRRHWKIRRDIEHRGYDKQSILKQIEERKEDARKYVQPQKAVSDLIVEFSAKNQINEDSEVEDYRLKLLFQDNVYVDDLVDELKNIAGIDIYTEDLGEFRGQKVVIDSDAIEEDELDLLARNYFSNLDEIVQGKTKWSSGFNGIIQLFCLLIICEQRKSKQYD